MSTAIAMAFAAVAMSRTAEPSPQAIEARAIRARTAIRSAHIVATVRIDRSITTPEHRQRIAEKLEVWQSPAGHRLERAPLAGGPLDSTGIARKLICRGCGPDGAYITFHPPKITANLYPRGHPGGKNWDAQLLDVRALGYTYSGIYGTAGIDQAVAAPGLKYLSAELVDFKGDRAILVRGVFPAHNNIRRSCWVVPGKGFNVVRVEVETPNDPAGPNAPPCFVESELALDIPSGVWYPRRSVRRTYYGGQLINDELVEVTTAEFDRVPDAVFSLAALGLPVGEPVYDNRVRRTVYWTGTGLGRKPSHPSDRAAVVAPLVEPTPADSIPSGMHGRLITSVMTALLAFTGVMLIRRALTRRT